MRRLRSTLSVYRAERPATPLSPRFLATLGGRAAAGKHRFAHPCGQAAFAATNGAITGADRQDGRFIRPISNGRPVKTTVPAATKPT